MQTFIENIFRAKTNDSENSILIAQWEYDKKLVSEALKMVSLIFPHYSLHDESHSISILNNIANILGPDVIKQLGSTDLWLLLEAAYCHDLGMVITSDMIKEAIENGEFLEYFQKINSDASSPLFVYTSFFEINDGKLSFICQDFNLDAYDAVKILFSGFFRSKHASNSKKAIANPMDRLSMDSPHIIIPERLYGVLGEICSCHTKNFNEVMQLPHMENGLSLDTAHPRFIACLLRLGDLLDLDNNRFSDISLRTIGVMPVDSALHKKKHRSITHIRIDCKHIEVIAKCPSPQVAKVTKEWFDWINKEFQEQTLSWNKIVPEGLTYYLPNVDETKVEIDDYINVNSTDSPKFTIDTDKALDILKGQNLYKDAFDSIRELIQNAVDSTLIRYYIEHKDETNFPKGINTDLIRELSNYTIDINIEKNGNNLYVISIQDKGIGLKRSHLPYLSNTGSSSKNSEKNRIVNQMPDWLRPSGTFGIGFQSVFLLTDSVDITTKDFFTDECYGLEMYKPSSAMKGDIYVKKVKHLTHPGLKIEFTLNSEEGIKAIVRDPFNAFNIDDVLVNIENKVKDYAKLSIVPIRINGNAIIRDDATFYDEQTGIEITISLNEEFGRSISNVSGTYYKNAKISNSTLETIKFLHPRVNIHKGKASDFLTIDRNSIKSDKIQELTNLAVTAVKNYILSDHFSRPKDVVGILSYCFFAKYYNLGDEVEKKTGNIDDEQLIFISPVEDVQIPTISAIKNASKVVIKTISEKPLISCTQNRDDEIHLEGNIISVFTLPFISEMTEMLIRIASDAFRHCYLSKFLAVNLFRGGEYVFTNDESEFHVDFTKEQTKELIEVQESRLFIHYIPGYDDIVIPAKAINDKNIKLLSRWNLSDYKVARILSPFIKVKDIIKDARNDEFYNYVCKLNGKSKEAVIHTYNKFVEDCKNKRFVKVDC